MGGYTAVEIANCNAFQLDVFKMGLTEQQRIKYSTKRVYGVILLENLPQLVIQIWYTSRFSVEFVPIFSIVFSFVAIILTVLTLFTQRQILRNQQFVKIAFDVSGSGITKGLSARTTRIRSEIGELLGI